jgi:hypothetical protein
MALPLYNITDCVCFTAVLYPNGGLKKIDSTRVAALM